MVVTPKEKCEIGILGGSGNYDPTFLQDAREIKVYTPFGNTSSMITIGRVENKKVAFIARHEKNHRIPPSKINYKANIWAMKELGVTRIISPCACGGIQDNIKRGDFIIADQLFDRTTQRNHSFFEGGVVGHVMFAEPYCPELRELIINKCKELKYACHPHGTIVTIEGPNFSTKAESEFYKRMGFHAINMTAYSEAVLARQLEICFATIAMVTDTDIHGDEVVTMDMIIETMKKNVERVNKLVYKTISQIPSERKCFCKDILKTAIL